MLRNVPMERVRWNRALKDHHDGGVSACFASNGHIVFALRNQFMQGLREIGDTGMKSGGDGFSGLAEAQNALPWKH